MTLLFVLGPAVFTPFSGHVFAQDSVGKGQCLPGDGTSPWADETAFFGSEQDDAFVVDLASFETSWKTTFGVAPLIKSSKTGNGFFSSLISAQSISRLQLDNAPFPKPQYSVWNAPGFGVNNDSSVSTVPPAIETVGCLSNQFATLFTEFATTDAGASYNGLIGGLVNRIPTDPSRLYVVRRVVGTNGCIDSASYSQLAAGTVDANGVVHFRADCFNCPPFDPCEGLSIVSGNNTFRVSIADRNIFQQNVISGDFPFGAFDLPATDWLIQADENTHLTPGLLSSVVTGGESVLLGANFGAQYVRGDSAGSIVSDQQHWVGTNVVDQRGSISYTSHNTAVLKSTHGTAAILARRFGTNCDDQECTDQILLWGLEADGEPTANLVLQLPSGGVTDNDDNFTSLTEPGSGLPNEFNNYRSQVAFRGGNSQVSMNKDAAGNLLVAAGVDHPFALFQIPELEAEWDVNYVAVARVNSSTGEHEWTMAGYTSIGAGKAIRNGPGGNTIGRMVAVTDGTGEGGGPSISAPMIDAGGNVWFVATVQLDSDPGQTTRALLRSVYFPSDFHYELELVLKFDDIFPSQGTGLNYQLSFIDLSDSNSISSGAVWSQNISQSAHLNIDPASLTPADPQNLGGLVMQAGVTYDVDGDGDYEDCTNGVGTDQEYNVLLFIGSVAPSTGCQTVDECDDGNVCTGSACEDAVCKGIQRPYGDLNVDASVDVLDLTCSLDAFQNEFRADCASSNADIFPCEADGGVDAADVSATVGAFAGDDLCCALPSGACCVAGECEDDVTEPDCFATLGDYRGDGSTCGEVICPAIGACCILATCFDGVSAAACDSQNGVFFGAATTCGQTLCDPIGACCNQGICEDGLTEDQCSIDDGDYLGDGTTCDTTTCPTGACCNAGQCGNDQLEFQCITDGGAYQGNGTACGGIECPGPPQVYINEIRIDQVGSDVDEYVELVGTPGEMLTGLTYVVIGDGIGGSGVIEAAVNLANATIPADGILLVGEPSLTLATPDFPASLNFENGDNVTHLVVAGFSGSFNQDLDTNDDGVLDEIPWIAELDRIALIEEDNPPSNTEYHYGPPTVGPDVTFVPAHAFRCPDGETGAWMIGLFDDLNNDTPGEPNNCAIASTGTPDSSDSQLTLRKNIVLTEDRSADADDPNVTAGGGSAAVILQLIPRGGSGSTITVTAGATVIVDAFLEGFGADTIRGYQVSLPNVIDNGAAGTVFVDAPIPSVDSARTDFLYFGDSDAEVAGSVEDAAKVAAATFDENAVTPLGTYYLGEFTYQVSEDASGLYAVAPVASEIAITGVVDVNSNFLTVSLETATIDVSDCAIHDADCNGTLLLDDHASFVGCLGGPGVGAGSGCAIHDEDGDGSVELSDWTGLQNGFGPSK
jgi:hypothetical protein